MVLGMTKGQGRANLPPLPTQRSLAAQAEKGAVAQRCMGQSNLLEVRMAQHESVPLSAPQLPAS